jgi:hypothetical protein
MAVYELRHRLLDPGGDLQTQLAEHVDPVVPAHDTRVLEGAGEGQVVGRPLLDADTHVFTIDVSRRGDGRVLAHDEHALDHDVRRGEGDLRLARRLDRQEADVGAPRRHRLERLPRRIEADELYGHPQPRPQLTCNVDRHAGRRRGRPLGEHRIAQIDRSPEGPCRRELLDDGRRPADVPERWLMAPQVSVRAPQTRSASSEGGLRQPRAFRSSGSGRSTLLRLGSSSGRGVGRGCRERRWCRHPARRTRRPSTSSARRCLRTEARRRTRRAGHGRHLRGSPRREH